MKIRLGFVSNSSSSSFIIAYTEGKPCKLCGHNDPNIVELISNATSSSYDDCGINAVGKDEVIEWLDNLWLEKKAKNELIEAINAVNVKKYKIASVDISHNNELLLDAINHMIDGKILYRGD